MGRALDKQTRDGSGLKLYWKGWALKSSNFLGPSQKVKPEPWLSLGPSQNVQPEPSKKTNRLQARMWLGPVPSLRPSRTKYIWETVFWRPLCKIMGKCIRKYFILELCYLGKITRYFQGLLSSVAIFFTNHNSEP